MPTLSQLFPLRRLSLLSRAPFWAQAIAICALFAIAGLASLDAYGVTWDEVAQRRIASANADYIITGNTGGLGLYYRDFRYFGIAFEMPLLLAECALGLQDSRDIFIARHLLTHIFFIAGGFVCGMLAYRMLGSRWAALLAMLMFLLHPRLYAHSFFNSKDIPFAAMLLITLYLAHRAFRRDTLGAFLLCGIVAGLAINIRPFALMLPPLLLAMRALDLWQAGKGERKRILASAGIFLSATLATAYIIHPYYWENPLRFVEVVRDTSHHSIITLNLFMGELYPPGAVPWNYIPVWFAITAPPVALALGAVGCAAVCWQAIARPLAALRDREIRFRILLLGCCVIPIAVVVALQSNIYNGWRHMYFLWGLFCLLAAVGLRALASGCAAKEATVGVAARLRGWVRGCALRQTLAYGAAGVGLITTATTMVALHPYEHVYFNALVDTKTPGALGERYEMDYWYLSHRQLLEYLLARYPDAPLRVWSEHKNHLILPPNDRERIVIAGAPDADFYLYPRVNILNLPEPPPIHVIRSYGSAVASIVSKDLDAYLAGYNEIASSGTLLARSDFDVYAHNGALYYLKEPCALSDADAWFFLHIFPVAPVDLPADRREHGFDNLNFLFADRGVHIGDKCVAVSGLPDYAIERIHTGQFVRGEGAIWGADINLAARAAASVVHDGIISGDYDAPVVQSYFDLYLSGNSLAYFKEDCVAGDADARFLLHIFPADPADLPADRREHGFVNRDFQFADSGSRIGDKCVAERELPSYVIERIRTGQFVSGEGKVWDVEFPVGR